MKTPSLRARVVGIGVGIVFVVITVLDLLLYVNLRKNLFANLDEILDDRAQIVLSEARAVPADALAGRLTELGLLATIRTADGREYRAEPRSPALGNNIPTSPGTAVQRFRSRQVALPDGGSAVVFVRRTGVDMALERLLRLEIGGTLLATVLAGLLLWYASRVMLRPLAQMADTARRTSEGQTGQRLNPDRPGTEVGTVATAFDEMVQSLEAAVKQARHAEARVETLHRRSLQILETANDAYVAFRSDGNVVDWNRRAEQLFGWSRSEALHLTTADLGIPGRSAGGGREDATVRHRDGTVVPVELSVWETADDSGSILNAFVTDVRERHRGEEARQRLASIVDSAQEAIFSTTLEGEILTWNGGAELLYGFTAAEAIGQPHAIIVPPDHQAEMAAWTEQVRRGRAVPRFETVRRCQNGTLVEVAVTASPVRNPFGEVVAQSIIARDITEQRWMARTLDETLHSLEAALEKARAAEVRMRRFLDDAAHQLRGPITGIRAAAETLLLTADELQRERLLAAMVREVSRANRLVTRLLRLARIDHELSLEPAPCDVVELCRTEVERVRPFAPHVDFTLRSNLEMSRLPLDATAVSEIVGNLLENASRHASTTIDIAVTVNDGALVLRTANDGPSLTDDAAARAFERFVSLDGAGGSGLGLPIARGLARAHGGDLRYEDGAFVLELAVGAPQIDGAAIPAGPG